MAAELLAKRMTLGRSRALRRGFLAQLRAATGGAAATAYDAVAKGALS